MPTQVLTEPNLGPLELTHHLKQGGKAHASRIHSGQVPEKHPSYKIDFFFSFFAQKTANVLTLQCTLTNSKLNGCYTM